ncbi:plexin-C1 [Ictalurus punctatus]|uniref:Plexin-C1 n=2 Tax=Ictalurus punctatus TaxID=7998 RepID=A0A9F7R746_ICTPU|nr:plexin-C1 [Ictalurus punctatus]
MRTLLLGIFILFKGAICTSEYNFNDVIRHFAVGNGKVFVVTDSQLHQMRHDLEVEKIKVISNTTDQNAVNILLPFEANGTLITCGTLNCGHCEVLDINDITRTIYMENLPVGPLVNESSVAFLVDYPGDSNGTYMLVGRENNDEKKMCTDAGVVLYNTLYTQHGDIFSKSDSATTEAYIKIPGVEWVNGFQVSSQFQSYLFANINLTSKMKKVVFFKMDNNQKKTEMTRSLKVATLRCCDDQLRQKLVSSAFISSESSLLWMGIFTAERPDHPENTVLAIYNITASRPVNPPEEIRCSPDCPRSTQNIEAVVDPLAVVFKHNSMTSVAAKIKGSWTVLYIGTANGQLMKLVLDTDYRSGCAKVLYRSDDDRMVFPRMYFDPVDHNYIYIALRNQIKRVAVTQCGMYGTLRDCIGSMDPFCGWCGVTKRCCLQKECTAPSWISIAKDSFQKELISFQVISLIPGEINLTVYLHLEATESLPLTCTFKAGSVDLCTSPVAHFPSCSCNFPEKDLSSDRLKVTVTVNISDQIFTDSLTLRSCPNITENTQSDAQCTACVSAGCYWNNSGMKCTWTPKSAPYVHIQDICKQSSSEKNNMEVQERTRPPDSESRTYGGRRPGKTPAPPRESRLRHE